MSIFFKHEWDDENKELTLFINPTEAFYEFSLEYASKDKPGLIKRNLLASARDYAKKNFPSYMDIKSYRVKFHQYLITVMKEKKSESKTGSDSLEVGFYQVRPHDTLKDIAQFLQINEETLKKENNLSADTLFIGMVLKVPVYRHTVVASDSLQKIANRFDTTKEALRKLNNLQTDCLCPGKELKIPKNRE